jgi:hypothetical protein
MTNSKIQIPNPKEIPNTKLQNGRARRGIWNLKFGACLGFGIWILEFISAAASLPLLITEPAGLARHSALITSGVPFPMGLLHTNMPL